MKDFIRFMLIVDKFRKDHKSLDNKPESSTGSRNRMFNFVISYLMYLIVISIVLN